MPTGSFRALLARELGTLRRELEAYPDDASLWRTVPGITNSGGTLALHLIGNLRHCIGARLGATGYVRDRAAEFSRRGVPREELVREVDDTLRTIERTLPEVSEERLAATFPEPMRGVTLRTDDLLAHLASHLAYHLGQIDYHRRILTGVPGEIGAMSLSELDSAAPAPDDA